MERPLSKGQKKRFKAKRRKERLTRLIDSPSDLSIVQINVKAAPDRIQSLKNWIHNCDKRVDILCLQDLPSNIRGIQFPDHVLAFGPNNPELLETQGEEQAKTKKRNALKIKSPYQEKEMLHAVAYLIHKSIPIADWDVEFHDDVNFGLAATLLLRISDDQTIAIHNVHNQLKKVKIPDLLQKVTATGQDFLVGDFNLHHTVWGGDKVKIIELQAVELANGLNQARMDPLTARGFLTYSRGQCIAGEYNSTIDLTYASSAIVSFVRKWESPDVPGFDSDHRVIMTMLNLEIDRVPSTYYLWKLADPNKFRACIDGSLKPLGFPALTTPAMTDNYARKVVQAFNPAIERLVPLAPPPGSKRPKARPSLVTQRAENLLKLAAERERNSGISTESQQHYKVKRFAQSVIRKERSASFHRMLSQDIAKRRRLYFWARRGATWNKKALMPIRQLKADNVTHHGTSEEQQVPRDRPPDDSDRVALVVSQDLDKSEVRSLIAGAPSGKAAGPDLLAYEGMKMAQEELLPYLHHLFAACLKLGHHPAAFKQACTVMLRKPGKDDYEQPKSWRPVALLPCMGKLLEKIVTHRLKQLAVDHNLLPDVQFGTPGKCTTKALQYLLNNVYYAWTCKIRRLATVMGLDITGAYDRVERVKLMKILQEAGLPEWMLNFIWSFLTDRSTDMKLPGFTSSSFWFNMGIPQGSPLSPLLFLFFSMPIVGAASEYTNSKVRIYPFAYVDDTYLLAVSDDYEDNCKALKECHDRIMVWADSVGVSFSPHKYHVMHFRPPRHRADAFKHMPKIPGLEGKKPEGSMRILGVEVDHRLNWREHVAKLYITTVRPIISHGCGAWFIYGNKKVKWQISKDVANYLVTIQNQCLKIVTGALAGTAGRTLPKEAYVEDILVFLERVATVQRARVLDTPDHERLRRIRRRGKKPAEFDHHPYHALDHAATSLLERANESCRDSKVCNISPSMVRKAMTKIAKQDSEKMSCKIWNRYCEERDPRHWQRSAAVMDKAGWGPHNLRRYRGLSRAQSTILIQCRTEFIALNSHLHWMRRSDTSLCDCEAADETVFHMFIQCELLATARRELYTVLGHQDFYRMLSEKPEIAADWAITHFDIPHVIQLCLSSTCVSPTALSCDLIQSITNRRASLGPLTFIVFPRTPKPSILTIEHLHRQFNQLDRAFQLHEPRPVWTVAAARCDAVDEGLLLPRYALTPFQAIG
ncbi:hypothetical protein BFJ70_g639 [Fusarium oxysporum]|nr:hypothetical protein BFJ70_g639 [Fusarium oxysporum]